MYEHALGPKRLCRTNSQHLTNSFVDILLESTGLIVISLMYSPVDWMVCCVAMWRGRIEPHRLLFALKTLRLCSINAVVHLCGSMSDPISAKLHYSKLCFPTQTIAIQFEQ